MSTLKLFATSVAFVIGIALTACGGGGGDSVSTPPVDTPPTPTPTAPAITTPPASQSVVASQTATFSVLASGSAPLAYQWKKNDSNIEGATSSTYTTPETRMADSGTQYSVVVSNSLGTVTSTAASLTVTATAVAPGISTQPASQSAVAGQTATFSVLASGSAPLAYQWKKNGTNVDGATSSTYTTPATRMADSGAKYSVSVSNSVGTVTSNNATLTVTDTVVVPVVEAPAITTQPAAQAVTAGQTATFAVTATGTSLKYQWKKGGTDISGANASSYTTEATAMGDSGAVFSVVVSNSAGSVTSSDASLTVTSAVVAPAITTQPLAQTVDAGQTASFSVMTTGTEPLAYQWKKNDVDIAGATSSTYTTPATGIGDNNALFTVVVSNSAGNAASSSATLTVNRYSLVANAGGGFYDKTECVKDLITGRVWEGKTASPATSRLGTGTYTNYDSTSSAQKWVGVYSSVNPTQTEIDDSTNSIGYRNSVRTSNLCGYNDWRMPTVGELQGILASSGNLRIDTTWFPNTQASFYWSSSPSVAQVTSAGVVNFSTGNDTITNRSLSAHVRLVR